MIDGLIISFIRTKLFETAHNSHSVHMQCGELRYKMKAYIILLVCSQFVCLYSLTLRGIGHHGWFDLNFGIV